MSKKTYITKKITNKELSKPERIEIALQAYLKGYSDLLTCVKYSDIKEDFFRKAIETLNKQAETIANKNAAEISKNENPEKELTILELMEQIGKA